jgi:hypothetical protein
MCRYARRLFAGHCGASITSPLPTFRVAGLQKAVACRDLSSKFAPKLALLNA